jgi:hypothetical protein
MAEIIKTSPKGMFTVRANKICHGQTDSLSTLLIPILAMTLS